MIKKLFATGTFLTALAFGVVIAQQNGQGPKGPGMSGGNANPPAVQVQTLEIEGVVSELNLGLGNRFPSMQIDGRVIILPPFRLLTESGFVLEVGDTLRVLAFQSPQHPDAFVAMALVNLSKGAVSLTVRDANGQPLWAGGFGMGPGLSGMGFHHGGHGPGAGFCIGTGEPLAAEDIQLFTGTVTELNLGVGMGFPTITLDSGITILVGPYRAWLDAGYQLAAGDAVEVTAFSCPQAPESFAAIQISGPQGTLVLRDETGQPVIGGHGAGHHANCRCGGNCGQP